METMKIMFSFPESLTYQNISVWIENRGRGIFRIGITEFAQASLDDIISVSLPEGGIYVSKDEELVTIDAIEDTLSIQSPFSGKIVEINGDLRQSPELLNDSPYQDGWILEIEIDDIDDLDSLLDNSEITDLFQEQLDEEDYPKGEFSDTDSFDKI
ncbi:MAG: glycine cleavage system protein H [Candidatus Heimdallarchaeota archaeon]|nr:glycine cleavage system protein H [Candidatus Heimdallarchaeota archaeon]